ncbi:cytidylate kinase [Porphyromonadaceae bacterium COT-184 OH4590]|nr:cytidylate kinase [Porphyromonadaceae bacterium COT-184 OH4590]MDO4726140.1 (d)CMP kinase [Porphyromonadaceae bacterium]
MENKIVVAIDGFSSCGKSTIAKRLAKDTGYIYVDTGAMYRAVGYFGIQKGIITETTINEEKLQKEMENIKITFGNVNGEQHTFLNGSDIEKKIRTLEVGNAASRVSTINFVRQAMVRQQQLMGLQKGIVMDGRDIGTVVFPKAELKIFVNADAEVRAKRRHNELLKKGEKVDYQEVLDNILERDYRDTHRKESPLIRAKDAKLLDNSSFDIELQQKVVMDWFNQIITN